MPTDGHAAASTRLEHCVCGVARVEHRCSFRTTFVFPLTYIAIALLGTVVLALLVLLPPLRRAVRFKPGEAIRYA